MIAKGVRSTLSGKGEARPLAVKIGGSTQGDHDTTVEDLAGLQKQGRSLVVAHRGMISQSEASSPALTTMKVVRIMDGRAEHPLVQDITGRARQMTKRGGTTIVSE